MRTCLFKGFDENTEKVIDGCAHATFIPHAADCSIDRINFGRFVPEYILQH